MKKKMIVLMTLVSLFLSAELAAAEVQGKIVAVNEKEEAILLKSGEQDAQEYQLSWQADISLNHKKVTLGALKPIDYKSFCEAKLELNEAEEVVAITAAYKAIEVIVTEFENNNLRVQKVKTGLTREFKVTDKLKMMRNNLKVDADDISKGDRGLAVLGLNNQLQKLIVFNYQVDGFLKRSNAATREIVLNVGSRLEPRYKKLKLPSSVQIRYNQKVIEFNQLSSDMWVQVEIGDSIRQVVVRKI